MAMSGVTLKTELVDKYGQIKTKKTHGFLTMHIENGEVMECECGEKDASWECFLEHLPPKHCRFCIVDFKASKDSAGKLLFIKWSPEAAPIKEKMIYAATAEGIIPKFEGIAKKIHASDLDDLDLKEIEKLTAQKK